MTWGEDEESLPFDAHIERVPLWGTAAAALTIVASLIVAARLAPTPLVVLPLVATSVARRLAVTPISAEIDGEGLWLGGRLSVPRRELLDVWFDAEDADVRVQVAARPDRMLVLHLPNAEQARRFALALSPEPHDHRVAGVRPRWTDALFALQFLALGLAALRTGALPIAGLVFALFLFLGHGLWAATQIDAGPDAVELRSFTRLRRLSRVDIAGVDAEAGRIDLASGDPVTLPARSVRTPLLATTAATRRAHARALASVRRAPRSGPPAS